MSLSHIVSLLVTYMSCLLESVTFLGRELLVSLDFLLLSDPLRLFEKHVEVFGDRE